LLQAEAFCSSKEKKEEGDEELRTSADNCIIEIVADHRLSG
jgi:hypothetical protein